MRAVGLLLLVGCAADPVGIDDPFVDPGTVYDVTLVPEQSDAEVLDRVFSGAEVEEFRIDLHPGSFEALLLEPDEWALADFQWRGLVWEEVGVRIKGNGSFRPITEKPSLKIEFDKYVDGQDFFGLDVLVLNNMVTDDSKIRERTAFTLYRAVGVPAPRAAHSVVYLNGGLRGLYTHMEDVDERMLAQWFDDPNGPLFELFDVTLTDADIARFEHEGGPNDRTLLQGAADALEAPTREEQMAVVVDYVGFEAFLRYYAASGYLGQFDAWPYNDPPDDVHLYADPATNRLIPIPHGLDESLADGERNLAIPGTSPLGQACYFTDCREDLRQMMWSVADTANAIDLAGQATGFHLQIMEKQQELGADEAGVQLAMDELNAILELLEDRPDRVTANLGPR